MDGKTSKPNSPSKNLFDNAGSSGAGGSGAGFSGGSLSLRLNDNVPDDHRAVKQEPTPPSINPSVVPILPAVAAAQDPTRSIRPPKAYYPKTDGDFKVWVRHLEHYFTLLNVDDGRKTTVLLYYLGNEASNMAFHLGITDSTGYEQAKNDLMSYFSPVETPEELRAKFHQRYQGAEESLEHFAMELRILCSKAYKTLNPDELEEMAKQQFILGVQNNLAKERLMVHRPESLKAAIEYGRLLEVAGRTSRGTANPNVKSLFATFQASGNMRPNRGPTQNSAPPFDSRPNTARNNVFGGQFKGYSNHYSSGYVQENLPMQRKPITCWSCGKIGHRAANCRTKPLLYGPPGGGTKGPVTGSQWTGKPKPQQSNMIVQSDEDDTDQQDGEMMLTGTSDSGCSGILAAAGEVAGKQVEHVIVDTGSAVSIISTEFYETIKHKGALQPTRGKYLVANGTVLGSKGSIKP
jgi:hypothetical protein